jgi:hypothetical protein
VPVSFHRSGCLALSLRFVCIFKMSPHVPHGEPWQDHSFLALSAAAAACCSRSFATAIIPDAQVSVRTMPLSCKASHVSWRRPCRNNTALSIPRHFINIAATRNMCPLATQCLRSLSSKADCQVLVCVSRITAFQNCHPLAYHLRLSDQRHRDSCTRCNPLACFREFPSSRRLTKPCH